MSAAEKVINFTSALDSVTSAGKVVNFSDYVNYENLSSSLVNSGFKEVITDAGTSYGWAEGANIAADVAGSTLGESTTVVTAANVASTETGVAVSSAAGLGSEAAGITLSAPAAILCGVAAAAGLTFGFDVGRYLVSHFFQDDSFDWKTDSIGGKIITYLTSDGTAYVSQDLVNRIMQRLVDIGAFESGFDLDGPTSLDESEYFEVLSLSELSKVLPDEIVTTFGNVISDDYVGVIVHNIYYELGSYVVSRGWYEIYDIYYIAKDYATYLKYIPYPTSSLKYNKEDLQSDLQDLYKFEYSSPYVKITKDEIINNVTSKSTYNSSWNITYDFWSFLLPVKCDFGTSMGRRYLRRYLGGSTPDFTASFPSDYTSTSATTPYSGTGTYNLDYFVEELWYPFGKVVSKTGVEGVEKQDDATYPEKAKTVPETYPEWAEKAKEISTPNEEDLDAKTKVLPLTIPATEVATDTQPDAQTGKISDIAYEGLVDSLPSVIEFLDYEDLADETPTEDTGETPDPVISPVDTIDSGFVAIYNPTLAQLSSFSQYLWTNDFIDNLKKLFEDPMNAIIGLHMIYATPVRGSNHNIYCGYLNSGVESRTLSTQYITLDCGSVTINKYYNNILDYSPYTSIRCYLPFIGIVDLDPNDIVGRKVNIQYIIDALTGTCIANIRVSRDKFSGVLYSYNGNCAVSLPISAGNYSSIISSLIGVGASLGVTAASGGSLAPAVISGAVSAMNSSKLNVSHSGSLGANAGALGIKKPYLVISHPKQAEASNFNKYYGKPVNITTKLSSCSGFTQVKEVRVSNISATSQELDLIESLLKEGVII